MEPESASSEPSESFFEDDELALELYSAVFDAVKGLGKVSVRVGKSQIALRRRRSCAAVWIPGRYVRGKAAPLVLTVYLPFREPSPRWKEVVEPAAGRFTHHLELWTPADVDNEVVGWLREAWNAAA